MSDPERDDASPTSGAVLPAKKVQRREEALEEEEKVLAGRADANMPALLTKDVLGG